MTTVPEQWRKSTRSGQDTNCVEVEITTMRLVRDSKNPNGPAMPAPIASLVDAVKADRVNG
jgi:hypothetical protein